MEREGVLSGDYDISTVGCIICSHSVSLIIPAADSHQGELSKAAVSAFENRQAINKKFADCLAKVCNKMLKNRVDIEEFQPFVATQFPPGDCIPQAPTNLAEIFEAITHHGLWDSLHFSPLVRIVQKFGARDPEMMSWIRKYKKDVKAYTTLTRLEDCIESNLDTCSDQSQVNSAKYDLCYNCPVEWKINFADHSLQHLTSVWKMFSVQYLGPDSPPTALLDHVHKDCMSVTWLVPADLIQPLIKRATIETDFFQEHCILKVKVGGKVVYDEEKEMVSSFYPNFV